MKFLLDNPNTFFRKSKENFPEAFAYLAAMTAIFVLLNEASIRAGLTKYVPKAGILESIAMNYFALLGGFFLLVFIVSFVPLKDCGFRKSFVKSFFVMAYAGTPLFILGWVPFAVVKGIALIWSLFFIIIGMNIRLKYEYRKAFFVTILIILVVYMMILLSRNEIVSIIPIYR